MNALRRQNSRPQQTFERWTPRTHESPRELAHQSEAKRKQAPQSEAKVCRHKCNLKKTSLTNCTGHPIMHSTPNGNWGLRSRTSNAKTDFQLFWPRYRSIEKYLERLQKSVNPKNNRYLLTYLDQNLAFIALFKRRNKPQNVLNISRGTSIMAFDTKHS